MEAPTVLLIDGDRDSLNIYSLILRHHGFGVLEAETGEIGYAMACEHQPDLIVLEPFVPRVSGLHVMELLQGDPLTASLRVLLVTAVPSMAALSPWGERFLVKPCRPRFFLAEVQRRLEPALSAA